MAAVTGLATFKDICIDAVDHQRLASWWCEVLGYERARPAGQRPPDWPVAISDPAGAGPLIWVNPVPEPKVVKNRMHIDVRADTEPLLAHGAAVVLARGDDRDWDVLADPEGNEFCVFKP